MKNDEKAIKAKPVEITTSMPMTRDCVNDIREIIIQARRSVVRHVNTTMTLAYWLIGRRIIVEEQKGGKRAAYGERLLERISRELGSEFGNGFGEPHLRNCRLFYKAYPTEAEIRYALRIKLTWTHHRAIMRVHEPKARSYYLREAEAQGWDTRELERQIRMFAYERVVANQVEDEEPRQEIRDITPESLLKDPCVAEFLNLRENLRGKEKKVEKRIIDNIERFMLELGKGFALVGRQYRVPIDGVNKYIDLVFYNYILRCFVLVDLKTAKLTSRDIGQMDAYRRMFDALKRQDGDGQTIGILLGTEIDEPEVKYSIMAECERIFATKLLPFLPTKAELTDEIERSRTRTNLRRRHTKAQLAKCVADAERQIEKAKKGDVQMDYWLTDEQFKRIKDIIQASKRISYQDIKHLLGPSLSEIITEEQFDNAYVNDEIKEFDKDGNGYYTIHLG